MEKIYCGSAKEKEGRFGKFIVVSVCLTDLSENDIQEYKWKDKRGKEYINIIVSPMKKVSEYGYTHSVVLDTYKPKPKEEEEPIPPQAGGDDLPF